MPELPGVPENAIRRTYQSWLHWGRSGIPLQTVQVYDLDRCEISMMIPFDPVQPWSGYVISSEPDTDVEMMAPSPPYARTASQLQEHCLSRFS
jgi:hypothetical protein